jgi:hypothetical protein
VEVYSYRLASRCCECRRTNFTDPPKKGEGMPITAALNTKSAQLREQRSEMEDITEGLAEEPSQKDNLWEEVNNEWKEEGYTE